MAFEITGLHAPAHSTRLELMDKEIAKRLEALERELSAAKQAADAGESKVAAKNSRVKAFRYKKYLLITPLVFLVGAGIWYGHRQYQHSALQGMIPVAIRKQADFPVYMPAGTSVEVEKSSVSYAADTLTFVVKHADNSAVITQQKLPSELDLKVFLSGEDVSNARQIPHDQGQFVLGKIKDKQTGILALESGTLMIVTSDAMADKLSITSLIKELRRIN